MRRGDGPSSPQASRWNDDRNPCGPARSVLPQRPGSAASRPAVSPRSLTNTAGRQGLSVRQSMAAAHSHHRTDPKGGNRGESVGLKEHASKRRRSRPSGIPH